MGRPILYDPYFNDLFLCEIRIDSFLWTASYKTDPLLSGVLPIEILDNVGLSSIRSSVITAPSDRPAGGSTAVYNFSCSGNAGKYNHQNLPESLNGVPIGLRLSGPPVIRGEGLQPAYGFSQKAVFHAFLHQHFGFEMTSFDSLHKCQYALFPIHLHTANSNSQVQAHSIKSQCLQNQEKTRKHRI